MGTTIDEGGHNEVVVYVIWEVNVTGVENVFEELTYVDMTVGHVVVVTTYVDVEYPKLDSALTIDDATELSGAVGLG